MSHPTAQPAAIRNRLLSALPPEIQARLLPRLQLSPMVLHDVLHVPESALEAVYFPESGFVSLVMDLEDGSRAEVGVIGCEGMVGVALVSGVETSLTEAMVQTPGTALRMEAGAFRRELDEAPVLRAFLLRYNDALYAQVAVTAACNGHHGLEQRLARWLLMAHDRTDGNNLSLTQDFLAMMLCVHRPSVTVAARILQRASLIHYASGIITVLDRPGLEAASCECYEMIRRQHRRLLG